MIKCNPERISITDIRTLPTVQINQKVIFTKNATSATEYMILSHPCYSYICISLRPLIALIGSKSTWGSYPPAGYAGCAGSSV